MTNTKVDYPHSPFNFDPVMTCYSMLYDVLSFLPHHSQIYGKSDIPIVCQNSKNGMRMKSHELQIKRTLKNGMRMTWTFWLCGTRIYVHVHVVHVRAYVNIK